MSYTGPNEISKYVIEMEWNLISMVLVSNLEYEPVTRGSPYNFIDLNSPVTGHLGKMTISPNW